MKRKKFLNLNMIVGLMIFILMSVSTSTAMAQEPLVVFLVRHTEKLNEDRESPLSEAGKIRAQQLADVLRDAGIQHIHSTDFVRTRETVAPLADLLGLELNFYKGNDLINFANQLKQQGGRHLVVGHTTTMPQVIKLLGGPYSFGIEINEYDRLYILTIDPNGVVSTVLMRFGEPYTSVLEVN